MRINKVKVAVALSGGVDSSVAAALLEKEGYHPIGLAMEIFDESLGLTEAHKHACFGPGEKEDIERAASICKRLKIPFHTVDLREEYEKYVLDYLREEYLAGRTPNPCVMCNQRLKFGFLQQKARQIGIDFDFFATGHYARIEKSGKRYLLKRAVDSKKDQTYFLYTLTPQQLSSTLLPIGRYTKRQVREIACSLNLETAQCAESQDFIAGGDYSLLFDQGEINEGDIVDDKGSILGRHRGIIHYTVGQRKGLGIASRKPLYVTRIDVQNNRLVVGDRENLYSGGLIAADFKLIAVDRLDRPCGVRAKIRLQHEAASATVFPYENGKVKVWFDEPQISVTPGQSAVLYTGDVVLGGGVIERAL